MTTALEPVLTGEKQTIEVRVRRPTLNRWRRLHPGLDIAMLSERGDYVRVRVMIRPSDLRPAGDLCYMTVPDTYRAGNARAKRWWGIEVRDESGVVWLDNHDSKAAAEDAARQWFLVQGINPDTVRRLP